MTGKVQVSFFNAKRSRALGSRREAGQRPFITVGLNKTTAIPRGRTAPATSARTRTM